MEFIIIFPPMFAALIAEIHRSPEQEVSIPIETIMPSRLRDYLLGVIRANRYEHEKFRFEYILEDPVTKNGLYEILKEQLARADMDRIPCFQNVSLGNDLRGVVELDMKCKEHFFLACRDSRAEFVYSFDDGTEETLVIEY